ncbi:MAG TPA: GNAT family N-acetyltransferase [Gaiellaceae bacterium]|nr:GNAT family N-acetyltransferase [Gaiellaceae bacterium]
MIEFRPITEADISQIQEWLDREHVARWWRNEDAATYLAQPHEHFLIVLDGRPVGMIQTYLVDDYPDWKAIVGDEPRLAGVDLFIGEEKLTGQGLGPRVLAQFADEMAFANAATSAVVATVEEGNSRSWRVFEKAGFRHVRDVEEEGLPHRLMRLERPLRSDRGPVQDP